MWTQLSAILQNIYNSNLSIYSGKKKLNTQTKTKSILLGYLIETQGQISKAFYNSQIILKRGYIK